MTCILFRTVRSRGEKLLLSTKITITKKVIVINNNNRKKLLLLITITVIVIVIVINNRSITNNFSPLVRSIRVEHIPSFVLSFYLFSFLSVRLYNAVSRDSHLVLDETQAIQNEACVYYVCHGYYIMSVHHVIEPVILKQQCSFNMPWYDAAATSLWAEHLNYMTEWGWDRSHERLERLQNIDKLVYS